MTDTVLREVALVMQVVEAAPTVDTVSTAMQNQLAVLEMRVAPVSAAEIPSHNRMK